MIRSRLLRFRRHQFARGGGNLFSPTTRAQKSKYASSAQGGEKQISPHILFYQQHGRALAKVFLMSFLAYQAIYWGWMKLETLELKENRTKEIADLEGKVKATQESAAQQK